MATAVANHWLYLMALGTPNFSSDSFFIILMESGFTFDIDDHEDYGDISAQELANGNGYTTGGNALVLDAVTEDDTADRTEVTWDSTSWTAAGGPIGPTPGACILDDTLASDPVVGYIDFGAEYTQPDGGVATLHNLAYRHRQPS